MFLCVLSACCNVHLFQVKALNDVCLEAKENNNVDFEVTILLDYCRGSRGGNNSSRTMLTPLLETFGDNVHVHLYHTPNLRGMVKSILPEKYDELIGINHMKIYLFDDTFIMSGYVSRSHCLPLLIFQCFITIYPNMIRSIGVFFQ